MNIPLKDKAGTVLKVVIAVSVLYVLFAISKGNALPARRDDIQQSALNSPVTPETSSALISEIRQLRFAFQDYTATNFRSQITLERMRFQQMLVERSERESTTLQAQIEDAQRNYQSMEEPARSLEQRLASERDPLRRGELEREIKALLLSIEQHKNTEASCRGRNAQAVAQLEADRKTLTDLANSLDQMEKVFSKNTSQKK
jgi:predicted  nucleic acid-binding Zn-ribbon protein